MELVAGITLVALALLGYVFREVMASRSGPEAEHAIPPKPDPDPEAMPEPSVPFLRNRAWRRVHHHPTKKGGPRG